MKTLIILSIMFFSFNSMALGFAALTKLSSDKEVRALFLGQEVQNIELIKKVVVVKNSSTPGSNAIRKRTRIVNRIYQVSSKNCSANIRVHRARDFRAGRPAGAPRFKVTILGSNCIGSTGL